VSSASVWVVTLTGRLEHWNGVSWASSPYPYARSEKGELAVADGRVWRVDSGTIDGHRNRLVIRRWTGRDWAMIASPHPPLPGGEAGKA
jgi:hypothetical protein